jgi:hypothetical protein
MEEEKKNHQPAIDADAEIAHWLAEQEAILNN